MKKIITITAIAIIAAATIFSFTAPGKGMQQTVSKTINMLVFTNSNYNAAVYDLSTASLAITVKKAGSKTNEVLWTKSFPELALKFFPASVNAFKEAIELPAVSSKDELQITYTLTYNTGGKLMYLQGSEILSAKQANTKLDINI